MKKTLTISLVFLLLSLNAFANSLSEHVGKYQAEGFVLEILENGNVKLFNDQYFGELSGKELSITERKYTSMFIIAEMPQLLVVTGTQFVQEAGCSRDKVQDVLVIAMGVEGPEYYCLDKIMK